jgi:inner membrane transporter RhtA
MVPGLGIAMVSGAAPFWLERIALKGIDRRAFGVLIAAEPAVGALAATVLLGETLGARQWIAIACVIMAGAGSVLWRGPAPGTEPDQLPV